MFETDFVIASVKFSDIFWLSRVGDSVEKGNSFRKGTVANNSMEPFFNKNNNDNETRHAYLSIFVVCLKFNGFSQNQH